MAFNQSQDLNNMGSVVEEMVDAAHARSGIHVYRLERGKLLVRVTNWGATILSLSAPDAAGKFPLAPTSS